MIKKAKRGYGFFIGLALLVFFLASLILPWIQKGHIQELKKNVDTLASQVTWLISYIREKGGDVPDEWEKPIKPVPGSLQRSVSNFKK